MSIPALPVVGRTAKFAGRIRFPARGKKTFLKSPILFLAHDAGRHCAHWLKGPVPKNGILRFSLPVVPGQWEDFAFLSETWAIRPVLRHQSMSRFRFEPGRTLSVDFEAAPAAEIRGVLRTEKPPAFPLYATLRSFPADFRYHLLADDRGNFAAEHLYPGTYLLAATEETKRGAFSAPPQNGRLVRLAPGVRLAVRARLKARTRLAVKTAGWNPQAALRPGEELWLIGRPRRSAGAFGDHLSFSSLCYESLGFLHKGGTRWEPHGVVAPESLYFSRFMTKRDGAFDDKFSFAAGAVDLFLVARSSGPCVTLRVLDCRRGVRLRPSRSKTIHLGRPRLPTGSARILGTLSNAPRPGAARLRKAATIHELLALAAPSVELYDAKGRLRCSSDSGLDEALAARVIRGLDSDRRTTPFRLTGLPAGDCTILVRALGRPVFRDAVRLRAGETLSFSYDFRARRRRTAPVRAGAPGAEAERRA